MELGRGAAYEEINAAARASGARVVLGTGIVPGISNVIVRAIADTLGGADVIETSLLLSASDAAGPASFDYFVQELTMPFTVHVNGAARPAHAFSDPRVIEFPSGSALLSSCRKHPRGYQQAKGVRNNVRRMSRAEHGESARLGCEGRWRDTSRDVCAGVLDATRADLVA